MNSFNFEPYIATFNEFLAIRDLTKNTQRSYILYLKDIKKLSKAQQTLLNTSDATLTGWRFLMHVLFKGFVRIRHYGILSNRSKKTKLQICRNLIKGKYEKPLLEGLSAAEIILKLFNVNVSCCSKYGSHHVKPYGLFHKRE